MNSENLKPCPFCGGELEDSLGPLRHPFSQEYLDLLKANNRWDNALSFNAEENWQVYCYHCGCAGKYDSSKIVAIESWNRRAADEQ